MRLPYKCKVQYLESTGTQYIDTGLQPDYANGDSTYISYYRADHTGSQPCVFGCRQTLYDAAFYVLMRSIRCNGSDIEWLSTIGDHTIEVNDSNITIDGAVYASMPQRVTCTRNMFLFALNNYGTGTYGIFSGMKLYDWKYYRNGVLAQHLIPVLDTNNVPCLYDKISGELFYNKGTGQFLYGPVQNSTVSAIPYHMEPIGGSLSSYAHKLQYLESTGTQYIDTNYVFDTFNKGSELQIKLYLPSGVTGNNVTFGTRQQADAKNSIYLIGYNLIVGDSDGYSAGSGVISAEQISVFRFADGKYSVNGGTEVDVGRLPSSQYSFGLFAFNTTGYFPSSVLAKSGTRIYYCKFYENGTLVHNFIPVLDFTGVPCMYDTVTNTFKYNAGTGTFFYSEAPYMRKLQCLQSTGTQYIDTGVKPDFANGDSIEVKFYKAIGDNSVCLFGSRQMPGVLNGFYVLGSTIVFCDNSSFDGTSFGQLGTITMTVDDTHATFTDKTVDVSKRITCAYNMYLFALNNGGYVFGNYSGMKLYYWKYYHNGTLAQHLIPVLDRDLTPCLYDTVSKQYFYNQGTGEFLYQQNALRKLNYLESTGTQWIDTGLIMSGADFTIEWDADTTDIAYDRTMFGTQCRDPENASNWIWAGQLYCTAAGKYNLYIGRNYKTNISISGGRHSFRLSLVNSTATLLVDGSSAAQISNVQYPPQSYSTILFGNNYNNKPQQRPVMRLYSWKATVGGEVVRDMIPVLDSAGVPCMYDTVTNTFKYNAGTGTFNYA